MRTIAAVVAGLLLASFGGSAYACRGRDVPTPNNLDRYTEIRLVQATGVHLSEYENYELMRRGKKPWPAPTDQIGYIYPTSSTPGFTVNVLVERNVRGPETDAQQITLGGCGVTPPALKELGIVFVRPEGGYAHAVWQSQGPQYTELLRALDMDTGHEP